jgi:hypothetical protein
MAARCSPPATPTRLVFGVSALLVLSGCAGNDAPELQPQATVTEEVTEQSEYPRERETLVRPRPGMLDVEPVRIWYEYGSVDDHTMLVTFGSQGPPCEVLDHVEVDETDTRLTITLYHGRDPDADPDEPCDGPPDRVFDVEVPLSRPFVPEEDVLIDGASLTDHTEIEAVVTPRPGMLDVAPVRWWYDYGRDLAHPMLVTFASQGPPCEVLDRVEVDEKATPPIITLYQGRDPDADPETPCDGPTRSVGVEVPLTQEFGPAGVSVYILAGITAETGEGPVINGGSLTASQ